MMDEAKAKQTYDRCEALLTECKLIGVHTVGMQSRLVLGIPVEVDMELIRSDLELIKGCVDGLRRAVVE